MTLFSKFVFLSFLFVKIWYFFFFCKKMEMSSWKMKIMANGFLESELIWPPWTTDLSVLQRHDKLQRGNIYLQHCISYLEGRRIFGREFYFFECLSGFLFTLETIYLKCFVTSIYSRHFDHIFQPEHCKGFKKIWSKCWSVIPNDGTTYDRSIWLQQHVNNMSMRSLYPPA